MKLSIIILCWNDKAVIANCLQSIYTNTRSIEFEVIVSDNGSTDGSVAFIRENYPQVRIIENGTNLRFAKANNVGIWASRGEYILILNPDTIIHPETLDKIVAFADRHPETGAFGPRVLNPDGSYQESARPFPTIRREWIAALCVRQLVHLSNWFLSDMYVGWRGDTEREVDWISGCCILARGDLIKRLGGFDEQFFYYYEDMDLCHRIWDVGCPILFVPNASITHLGGQSTKRFPVAFLLDSQVTRYRYYYKYSGRSGVGACRRVSLASITVRRIGFTLKQLFKPTGDVKNRLEQFRLLFEWNRRVDPVRLVENGEEPQLSASPAVRVLER